MFQKCSKNVPKMSQKCPKNVPKMYQKCSKNVQKMVKKWSKNGQPPTNYDRVPTAYHLRYGALDFCVFGLKKTSFFICASKYFFWNAKLQGIPQNLMLFQSRILTEPEHFFMIECPPDFGFCEEGRKKKKERRKNANRENGLTWIFFSSHVCFRNCGFETVPFGRHVALSPELLIIQFHM